MVLLIKFICWTTIYNPRSFCIVHTTNKYIIVVQMPRNLNENERKSDFKQWSQSAYMQTRTTWAAIFLRHVIASFIRYKTSLMSGERECVDQMNQLERDITSFVPVNRASTVNFQFGYGIRFDERVNIDICMYNVHCTSPWPINLDYTPIPNPDIKIQNQTAIKLNELHRFHCEIRQRTPLIAVVSTMSSSRRHAISTLQPNGINENGKCIISIRL